jgi:hypothetical protein
MKDYLRLYGPLEPYFDKTWKQGEFELVKRFGRAPDESSATNPFNTKESKHETNLPTPSIPTS